MSYRTIINEKQQLFGNNDSYKKWIVFIKSQGIAVDEDECYEGEITDIMGAITVLEEIVMDLEKLFSRSLYNFENTRSEVIEGNLSLLDASESIIENSYIMIPHNFVKACEGLIVQDKIHADGKHLRCYKLSPGVTGVPVKAR